MTTELRRGILLAFLGLLAGLGVVAILAGTGLLPVGTPRPAATPPAATALAPSPVPPFRTAGPGAGGPRRAGPRGARVPALPERAARPVGRPSRDAPAGRRSRPAAGERARGGARFGPCLGPRLAPRRARPRRGRRPARGAGGGRLPAPSFDVVRIEPDGSAVVAGRGAPGASVELLRDGEVLARAQADASGLFAFVPPPLPSGTSEITLRTTAPDGRRAVSRDSVVAEVAPGRTAKPLVALASPGRATVVLSRPEETRAAALPSAAPAPGGPGGTAPSGAPVAAGVAAPPVKVVSVEAEDGGRLYISAQAAPGAAVRLYLNDTLVGPGSAGPDGRVTFAIGRGMRSGDYRVRIDQVDPVSGEVRTRSEVPFAYPSALARALPDPTPGAAAVLSAAGVPPAAGTAPAGGTPTTAAPGSAGGATAGAAAPPGPRGPSPVAGLGAPVPAAPVSAPPIPAPPVPAAPVVAAPAIPGAAPGELAGGPSAAGVPLAAEVVRAPAPSPAVVAAGPPSEARPAAPGGPLPGAPGRAREPGTVFVPKLDTATVSRGDNLWRISRRTYGQGLRFTVIYDANQDQIRNPRLIYPGQIFVLPTAAAPRQADVVR